MFHQLGLQLPPLALEHVRRVNREAQTAMIVNQGSHWGVIAAADQVRPTSADVVAQLKRQGVQKVVLISGDSARTVEAIANRTHVDEHYGALLPEDKVNVVGALETKFGAVAMVGDGINDAPALARASVGVAMGGIGSDAAMESADVVLIADDLTALPYAVRLSRKARTIVRQNLVIAIGVMAALVTLVFLGQHTPFGALKKRAPKSG